MRKLLAVFAMVIVLVAVPMSGLAASPAPELFGSASFTATGAQLTSDTAVTPGYAGIDFPAFAGMTLSSLTSLGADYQMMTGDCFGGAPRYTISLSSGHHIFVYFGDAPNYQCGTSPRSQSNLLSPNVDTSQIPGGTFYDTWDHALSLAGSETVTDLAIAVDGGWGSGGTQVVDISSASINGTTYNFVPPTSMDQCTNGGWQNYANPTFQSQAACIVYLRIQHMHQGLQQLCNQFGNPWFCSRIENWGFSGFY